MNPILNTLHILILLRLSLSQQALPSKPTTTSSTIARLLYQPPSCPQNIVIDCGVSPCTYTTCPAYHPNVICRENNCGGCSAIFFNIITGEQLTDRQCNTLPTMTTPTTKAPTTKPPIILNVTAKNSSSSGSTTSTTESEGEEDEGYEYEYPKQVDQYQKTRDNYGVNLNDEMIDIGRDLVNYGDLDINVAWPYTLQSLSNPFQKYVRSSVPCTPSNDTSTPCITVNTTNGTIYYQVISTEEIGDDPVVNEYTIDNVQKTRDNMGLNLNDEVVDIGRDLINYGTLHYNMIPVSQSAAKLTASSSSPCSMIPCVISPCQNTKCPSYPTATCRDDFCGGCYAIFTNPETGDDLTASECNGGLASDTQPIVPSVNVGSPCAPDEKICSDGSIVFRQSMQNCQFSACSITDSIPQSAKIETEQQLPESFIPCILNEETHCDHDEDCCGGICDIDGYCVNNDIKDVEKEKKMFTPRIITKLIFMGIFVLFGLGVLLLLYCYYCKKCVLPRDKIRPRREIFDDVESE